MVDYAKFEKLAAGLDDDEHPAKKLFGAPPPGASSSGGKNPVDELLSLKSKTDPTIADLKAAMAMLPPDAKHKFLSEVSKPGVVEALTKNMDQLHAEDPAKAASLMAGMKMTIHGLKAKPELNGKSCRVVEYVAAKGRCAVQVDGESAKLLVKPENLSKDVRDADLMEKLDVIERMHAATARQ